MSKSIEISDVELPLLIGFYTNQLEIKQREVDALRSTLSKLTKGSGLPVPVMEHVINDNGYDTSWTWINKIDFILKGKSLTTTEIVAEVIENEPNKADKRNTLVRSVSAVMSVNSKEPDGRYIKIQNERNENVFSLRSEKTVL